MVPWSSALGGFAYSEQSKWVRIIAIKAEGTCSREWTIFKNCAQTLSYEFSNLTEFKFTKKLSSGFKKTINQINENCLFQVLNCSDLYFLTLEFLISIHANFHHTSSSQGSNESCTVPQTIPNRKWTANDPPPQVIPKVDPKWYHVNLRNGMDFMWLITKKDWL